LSKKELSFFTGCGTTVCSGSMGAGSSVSCGSSASGIGSGSGSGESSISSITCRAFCLSVIVSSSWSIIVSNFLLISSLALPNSIFLFLFV
jgi:hypothetical protein